MSGTKVNQSSALQDVLAERVRQIQIEGFTSEQDLTHNKEGELAAAAGCYALHAFDSDRPKFAPAWWPWAEHWYKPTDPRRDLVKAAALILAEIERLDALEGK